MALRLEGVSSSGRLILFRPRVEKDPYSEVSDCMIDLPFLHVHELTGDMEMNTGHLPLSEIHRQQRGESTFEDVWL